MNPNALVCLAVPLAILVAVALLAWLIPDDDPSHWSDEP